MPTHHEIPATPDTMVLGYFDAALPPVLEIESGDTVTLHSFPAGGKESLHPDPARVPADYLAALDTLASGPGPHFVTGPVHVRGAEPGDVLQVDILDLKFRMDWGFVAILPLLGTLPDEFTDYETIHPDIDVARGVAILPWGAELPLDPFFGIMGTAPPAAWGRVGSPVPRAFGGNMDNKELKVGTALYFSSPSTPTVGEAPPRALFTRPPARPSCPSDSDLLRPVSAGALANSVTAFGANGVLGVGVFREDCGSGCAGTTPVTGWYYGCPISAAACAPVAVATAAQLQNPVVHFATDNNGVVIQLAAVDPACAIAVNGTLVFGIDTQANNALGAATILRTDALGNFTTQYNGQSLPASFVDSGSNALFFPSTLPLCASTAAAGYYCPPAVQSLTAANSSNGVISNVSFNVASAEALIQNATFSAFSTLAGSNPLGSSFDWGVPFFYGRHVYVAIEQQTTSAGAGPFVAY